LFIGGGPQPGSIINNGTVNVSSGTLSVGGDTLAKENESIVVGSGGDTLASLNVSGTGTVTVGAGNLEVGASSQGLIGQTGGTVNLFTTPGTNSWLHVGDGTPGTYTLSGGTLTLANPSNDLVLGNIGSGEFDLNGGTATLGPIYGFGSSSVFNFNGGTLRPNASQASMNQPAFMSGLTTANVRNGGAIIDTNGFNVTIAQPLVHSTISGDNATDGGLIKLGAGTLTLTGVSTYNGPTSVFGGTLLVQAGTGGYDTNSTAFTILGAGSTLGTVGTGPFIIDGGTSMYVTAGGQFAPSDSLTVGKSISSGDTLVIDGAGSTATLPQNASFTLGVSGSFGGSGTLTVSNNATFIVGAGGTSNIVSGTININGGIVDLKTLNDTGGSNVTVNFNSGSLSFIGDLHVGVGGFLGQGLTLDPSKVLTLSGTTTIDQFETLTLSGGALSTGNLVNNGTFNFKSGTLNITGSGGLTIGSGGALGSSYTVPAGANLNVVNATVVNSGSSLTINGGSFSTGSLGNFGFITSNGSLTTTSGIGNLPGATIQISGGTFTTVGVDNSGSLIVDGGDVTSGLLANRAGAIFYIGQNMTATIGSASLNAGEIQLGGGSALLTGAGSFANTGLIHGDGIITNSVTNNVGGEIRAEAGKRIKLSGTNGPNAGNINLLGGMAEFSQPLTIAAGGQINGQGNLIISAGSNTGIGANQSSVFGLTNNGTIQFSGGDTNIYGSVNLPGVVNGSGTITGPGIGNLLIGAGANAVSFYGDVWNNGNLFRIATGSYAVFFGTVHGASSFSGGGTVDFEGTHQVGNSPAVIGIGGNAIYGVASALDISIGGTTPGNGAGKYAQVNVAGSANLAGTLNLIPYNGFTPVSGDNFTVMTYASETGAFSSTTGTSPAPGLTYNAVYLPTSLVILTTANGEKTWGVNSDGNSSFGSNWIGGVAPGGVGDTATFSTIITAPQTVTLDADTTVGTLNFDSPNNYTIAGTHTLTLQAAGSTAATINVSGVHGNGAHTVSAPITLASNLNVIQNSTGTFTISGPLNDAAGKQINVSGTATTAMTGSLTLGNGTAIFVSGSSTLRMATTSAAAVGSGVTAVVSSGATLELAGTASALANGPGAPAPAGRVNITNNSNAPGVLVSGTNQQVGNIDGSGTTQVNAGSDLTANQIIQSALIIGGTASGPALVTINASDALGSPLGQSRGIALAGSLMPSGPFGASGMNFANLSTITSDSANSAVLAMGNPVRKDNTAPVPEPSTLLLAILAVFGVVSTDFLRCRLLRQTIRSA